MHYAAETMSPDRHVPGRRDIERLPAAAIGLRAEINTQKLRAFAKGPTHRFQYHKPGC